MVKGNAVDVLAVMQRDDEHARKHRLANQDLIPMCQRVQMAGDSEDARAIVAELIAAATELCEHPYDDPPQGRLWAAIARIHQEGNSRD